MSSGGETGEGEPSQKPAGFSRRAVVLGLVKLLVGVVLLTVLVRYLAPSWSEIRATVSLDYRYFFVALAGTGTATAVGAQRWRLLAELMGGARLPYAYYYHYLALTRFIGQFTSVAAMDAVGRGVALSAASKEGPRMGQHIGALLVERLLDLLLPLATFAWAIASVKGWLAVSPWVSLAVLAVVFLAAAIPFLDPATRAVAALFGWVQRLRKRSSSVVPLPAPPSLAAKIGLLSLARYACVILQFWATGALAGLSLDALTIAYATPVSQLTAFVGVTPGGIGIQDAGWAGALSWLGISGSVIAAYILVTRVAVVCIFAVLSLASLPFARRQAD